MAEVLGELYGLYLPVTKLTDEQVKWLESCKIKLGRSELNDAAGINDDFPIGRGVFIDDNHEFVVLVNFEDHVEVIMLPG